MDEQRPPDPAPEDDEPTETPETPEAEAETSDIPSSEQPTMPIERAVPPPAETPDAQATQPVAYPAQGGTPPPATPLGEPSDSSSRMELLRTLTPAELTILRQRCSGATSDEIDAALGIASGATIAHLGNIYDKLGITYGTEGTSQTRLLAYCQTLNDPAAPSVPPVVAFNRDPNVPIEQSSQRAMQLVAADDAAFLAQRPAGAQPPEKGGGDKSGWIIVGILAGVILLALIVFALAKRNDDNNNEGAATATRATTATTVAQATEAVPTATTAEQPTAVEATATSAPEATATPEPPTATLEPTATEEPPTATIEPTATEEPPTPTQEPPTATTEPTAVATPQPAPGTLAFEANWSAGAGDWQLTDGWTVADGKLVGDGATAAPLLSPFVPQQPDYAVEVQLTLANVNGCTTVAGPFARVTQQSNLGSNFDAGYMGNVCADGWRIDATKKNNDNRDTLASGPFPLDGQPHVYRLEVVGTQVRLFIDGVFAGEATNDSWADAGQIGIYLDGNIQVTVGSFKVYTLTGG